jgi:hypothetical protein
MRGAWWTVGLLLLPLAQARAHGGIGLPTLRLEHPAAGEILEATGAPVAIRWVDLDPDDDANIVLSHQSNPADALTAVTFLSGASEDCDPADGGPVYTGILDGGMLGTEAMSRMQCGPVTNTCEESNDCYPWTASGVVQGNYFILGSIDDDRGDGTPFDTAYSRSRGIVRVHAPGQNVPPALVFMEPDGVGDLVDTCFRATWRADDPDDNALITLWMEQVDGMQTVMVAQDLPWQSWPDGHELDLTNLPSPSEWSVHARITDGHHPAWEVTAEGHVFRYPARAQDGGCVQRPPPPDAGAVEDASVPDASTADASTRSDAASPLDAAAGQDDASSLPPPSRNATRCSAPESTGGTPAWLALLCLLVGLRAARRSRP